MMIPGTPEPRHLFTVGERVRVCGAFDCTIKELRNTTGYIVTFDGAGSKRVYYTEQDLERRSAVDLLADIPTA